MVPLAQVEPLSQICLKEGRKEGIHRKLPKQGATRHVPSLSSSASAPCPEVWPGSEVATLATCWVGPSPHVAQQGDAEGARAQMGHTAQAGKKWH